jgi:hypothetical protein
MRNKKIGIYKITSPSNRIYIGQSVNIENRFIAYNYYDREYDCYIKNNRKSLILLSLKKYGTKQHKFEIIEECSESELNEKEIFYIEQYKCNYTKYPDYNGLNLQEGGNTPPKKYGIMSESTKNKISEKLKERHSKSNNYTHKQCNKSISKYDSNGKLIVNFISLSNLIKNEKLSITKFISLFIEFNKGILKNGDYYQFDDPEKFKYDYEKRKSQILFYEQKKRDRLNTTEEQKKQIESAKQDKKNKNSKAKNPWTKEIRSEFFRKLNTGRKHINRKKPVNKNKILKHLEGVHKSNEKPVLQYTKNGIFVQEFESLKDAATNCGGKYQGIYRSCVGKRPSAYGYCWKYKEAC